MENGNPEQYAKTCIPWKRKLWGESEEHFGTEHKCAQITGGFYHSSLWGNWGLSDKETVSRLQLDGKLHFRCTLPTWWVSSELANSGPIRIHSGDILERTWHTPGNEWGQLPEWSSSWSEGLSEPNHANFWPRWPLRQQNIFYFTRSQIFLDFW